MTIRTITTKEGTKLELSQGLSGSGNANFRVFSRRTGSIKYEMSDNFPTQDEAESYMEWGFR